jgi:hypothetical protein
MTSFLGVAEQRDRRAEGDHADGDERRNHGEGRGQPVERLADVVGREVLLEEKFHAVGHRLDQAEEVEVLFEAEQGEGNACAVGAHAVLDHGAEAALEIDRDGNERQHHQNVSATIFTRMMASWMRRSGIWRLEVMVSR